MEFSAEEVRFLVDEKIREAVAALAARNLDEWGLSRELLKTDLPPERRRVVAEAVRLFPKIKKKFRTDAFLVADALALMQASGADVGRRKAAILAGKGERVLDVCCGMGGDSIHLPPEVRVEGIDLSEARLEMFRFNHARMRGGAEIRREDAEGIDASGALVLVDPDRRDPDDRSRNWNPANLSPSLEATLRVAAGASGALVKSSSRSEIVDAIRGVMAGKQVLSDEIRHTIENFSSMPELSPRQMEILNLVAKGFSNKEIAEIIGISPDTVKEHVANIFQRIGASSRAEAATLAVNLGLITG